MAPFQLTATVTRAAGGGLPPRRSAGVGGLGAPGSEVGAEVLHVLAERAVEQHVSGGVVLGEVGQPAVAEQPVAAGQAEQVALAGGEQRL